MNINLNDKIEAHLTRLENMAKEAEGDEEQSYSNRSAAMRTYSDILKDLVKSQAEIINMERLMKIESVTIETILQFLNTEQIKQFYDLLEKRVGNIE